MARTIIGTITFPTRSALALWRSEILGQLSDGAWENTAPHDHWEFWHQLRTEVNAGCKPLVVMDRGKCLPWRQKTGYNIAGLYQYVGDRMLAAGKMGKVLTGTGMPASPDYDTRYGENSEFDACIRAAEYLEKLGLTAFLERGWDRDDNYQAKYLRALDEETARRFFLTEYTMRDLKKDVALIKAAMKTARS